MRFKRCVREYIDIDYWNQLNAYETNWLRSFLDAEYNARPPDWYSKEEKQASYSKKYSYKNDLFSNWIRVPLLEPFCSPIYQKPKQTRRKRKISLQRIAV